MYRNTAGSECRIILRSVVEMKKYIPIVPTESENNLCLEVLYSKGGHNWFNGDNERRGYYLHCTPTLYFPKRKTAILSISRESCVQIQNLAFLLLIT